MPMRKKTTATPRSAYQRGIDLLARREYSQRELRQRLVARGHDAAEAETALGTLVEQHYQSDARYAEMLARSRAAQGYGPRRIRMELAAQGITRECVQVAMDALNHDWAQSAADLLRRRYGASLGTADGRARAAQFLLRRGFDATTVRSATRTELDAAADGDD
jgi:regulatory protein